MAATRLFMVIETFKPGKAPDIYRRFAAKGRMAPDSVTYVASWIDLQWHRCWQVMEAPDEDALRAWMVHWTDLMDFEVVPVRTSAQAVAAITPEP